MFFNNYKKITSLALSFVLVFLSMFGLVVTYELTDTALAQATDTDTITVTLEVDSGISISFAGNVTMLPNLGISGNSSVGSTTLLARTNDPAGYRLEVEAGASPAMVRTGGGGNIADYATTTPEQWFIEDGSVYFGFSVFGDDVVSANWGTDGSCETAGTLGQSGERKYRGFAGATKIQVANNGDITSTEGVETAICFAAQQKGLFAEEGTYVATITATATVDN